MGCEPGTAQAVGRHRGWLCFGEEVAVAKVAVAASTSQEEGNLGANDIEYFRDESEARVFKLVDRNRLQFVEPHYAVAMEWATAPARQ